MRTPAPICPRVNHFVNLIPWGNLNLCPNMSIPQRRLLVRGTFSWTRQDSSTYLLKDRLKVLPRDILTHSKDCFNPKQKCHRLNFDVVDLFCFRRLIRWLIFTIYGLPRHEFRSWAGTHRAQVQKLSLEGLRFSAFSTKSRLNARCIDWARNNLQPQNTK